MAIGSTVIGIAIANLYAYGETGRTTGIPEGITLDEDCTGGQIGS
jgi:hypothetical protein